MKIHFWYKEHPTIKFYTVFYLYQLKTVDYDINEHVFIEIKNVQTGLKLAIF